MLETVGVGAGAELADGAGAGAVLGGASVADLDGAAAAAVWLAFAVGWAPAWVPAWGAGRALACGLPDAVGLARLG